VNEKLAKLKKKFFTKRIRKICIAILIFILSGALVYVLPFTNELKESLLHDSSNEQFEQTNSETNEDSENMAEDSPISPLEEDKTQPNTSVSKPQQIELNCKKYASFISNFIMLQEKISTGRGFNKEISELSSFNITDNNIKNKLQQLSLFSEEGIPTFINLRDEFYTMSDEIIRAYQLENETNQLRKKALRFFQELIFIKKVGQRAIKEGGIEGIIQNIKNSLENEEILEAILEAEKITNIKVKNMVDSWIQDSRNYLKLQEIYEDLKKQTFEKINCSSFVNN